MDDKLIPGTTVIGTRTMRGKDNTIVEAEVLYGGEESGYLRTATAIKKCPDDEYRRELAEYREKMRKELEADSIMGNGTEYDDDGYPVEEPMNEEPTEENRKNELVKQQNGALVETGKDDDEQKKLNKKKLMIPLTILGVVVVAVIILLLVSTVFSRKKIPEMEPETEQQPSSIGVAVLNRKVAVGELVSASDFDVSYVSRDTFDVLSKTTYIGANGKAHEGTVILWSDIDGYDSYVALRTIEAGSFAMADDFALSRSAITGQMTIRLIAVIGSESLDDGEIVCELGRYVVEAGSLTDILNSQGQSILEDIYSEAEIESPAVTEEQSEAVAVDPAPEPLEEVAETLMEEPAPAPEPQPDEPVPASEPAPEAPAPVEEAPAEQ